MGEARALRAAGIVKGEAHAAALRDDADAPLGRLERLRARLDLDGRAEGRGDMGDIVVEALGIGAADAQAGAPRQGGDLLLEARLRAALLGEARGDDHGMADPRRRAFLERRQDGLGGEGGERPGGRRAPGAPPPKTREAPPLPLARGYPL